jgi:hypothetical protein
VTESGERGRWQMLSVILLMLLLGVVSQLTRQRGDNGLLFGQSFGVILVLMAVLVYNGHRRTRVVTGLLFLAGALAFVFVGLTRAIDGVRTAWYLIIMSGALAYGSWVILRSKSAREFLEEKQRALEDATRK